MAVGQTDFDRCTGCPRRCCWPSSVRRQGVDVQVWVCHPPDVLSSLPFLEHITALCSCAAGGYTDVQGVRAVSLVLQQKFNSSGA